MINSSNDITQDEPVLLYHMPLTSEYMRCGSLPESERGVPPEWVKWMVFNVWAAVGRTGYTGELQVLFKVHLQVEGVVLRWEFAVGAWAESAGF